MNLIVASEADSASINLKSRLLEMAKWTEDGDFNGRKIWKLTEDLIIKMSPKNQTVYNNKDLTIYMGGVPVISRDKYVNMAVEDYGWTIILINQHISQFSNEQKQYIDDLRVKYKFNDIVKYFDSLTKLKVLLVGEVIIDEYVFCNTMGKSGKEPVLVSQKINVEKYAGGILSVANQISDFCKEGKILSYLGERDDQNELFVAVENASYQEIKTKANGYANNISKDNNIALLANSTYSFCPVNNHAWFIRANQIELNTENNRAIADKAQLIFFSLIASFKRIHKSLFLTGFLLDVFQLFFFQFDIHFVIPSFT